MEERRQKTQIFSE